MNEIMKLEEKSNITSLELLEQINFFRKQEDNRTKLRHDTLLNIIKDEFSEEISLQNILESEYKNSRGKKYPMFILTLSQAKQVLVRESKFVRRSIINYVEKLENFINNLSEKQKLIIKLKEPLIAIDELFGIEDYDNVSYEALEKLDYEIKNCFGERKVEKLELQRLAYEVVRVLGYPTPSENENVDTTIVKTFTLWLIGKQMCLFSCKGLDEEIGYPKENNKYLEVCKNIKKIFRNTDNKKLLN